MDVSPEQPLSHDTAVARPVVPTPAPATTPRLCGICGRALSDDDGLALDCGGDCAACMAEVGDPQAIARLEAKLWEERRQLLGWCGWGAESVIAELAELAEVVEAQEFCLHCACDGHHVWEHWAGSGWACHCPICQSDPEGHVCSLPDEERDRRWSAYQAGQTVDYLHGS